MMDFLKGDVSSASVGGLVEIGARLFFALLLGFAVSGLYRGTVRRSSSNRTFLATLVLMSVLVALATQVVGDHVARAFSLVGALSIVRFRTAVEDTLDIAFVIFSVVVGMAAGAGNAGVALTGTCVVGLATFCVSPYCRFLPTSQTRTESSVGRLSLRVPIEFDVDTQLTPLLTRSADGFKVVKVTTNKQGTSLDLRYRVTLKPDISAASFVIALKTLPGVQSVDLSIG